MLDFAPINRTRPLSDEQAVGRRHAPGYSSPPVSSAQIRAARAMLDWSMLDLASAARVSVSTVKRFEDVHSGAISEASAEMILDALETQGVRFLSDDVNGSGLQLRRPA